jgi:hypothetical protein
VYSLCHECSKILMGGGSMSLRAVDFNTPIEMLTGTTSFKVPPKKLRCVVLCTTLV